MNGILPSHEDPVPAMGPFRALPSFRIHLLAGMSARHAELRFMKQFGLRLLETRILGLVGTFEALSLKEICQESDIEKSHASRLIARLQERGLVEKIDDDKDQRAISVRLTPHGQTMHEALYAEARGRNDRWLSVLNAQEQRQLLGCVEKLIARTRTMLEADATGTRVPEALANERSNELVSLDRDLAQQLFTALGQYLHPASEKKE